MLMSNMFIISLVRVLLNDPPSTTISLGDFTSAIISSIPKPSPSVSPTPISLVRVLGQGDVQHVHLSQVRVLLNDPPSTTISLGDFTSAIISSIPKPSPPVSPTPHQVRLLPHQNHLHQAAPL
jgi:hypothetical protein